MNDDMKQSAIQTAREAFSTALIRKKDRG